MIAAGLLALWFPVHLGQYDQWGMQISCGRGFNASLSQTPGAHDAGLAGQCGTALLLRRLWAIPAAIVGWVLVFDNDSGSACATPVHNVCPPMRTAVLNGMMDGLPRLCAALVISLVLALLIRLGSGAWRPVTAAFAAAIIGGGAATILFTVMAS